jgi:site-specific DNA-methyltransferase (adenine-specific)
MRLLLGDAHALIRELTDGSVDAIITDPPYGVFQDIDPHLDTPPRPELWKECYRVAKRDAWLATFGQMPSLTEQHQHITEAGWRYVEHIVWLKRTQTPSPSGLHRSHESILLYRKGNARLYDKTAPYWDTKIPLLGVGGIDIGSVRRAFGELYYAIKHGKYRVQVRRPDALHKVHQRFKAKHYPINFEARNVGNVWSFLNPRRLARRYHPTQKPLPLMERLVKLLTCEGQVVLDPFLGSGTTAVACARLGRQCIGFEHNAEYLQVAQERVREAVLEAFDKL